MRWRLATRAGRAVYALRKQTMNPSSASSRRCSASAASYCVVLAAVSGEWTLISIAYNLKRLNALRLAA